MNEVTTESNQIIMPLIFVVILIVLFISFRKFSYIFLPLFALLISVLWLFGTMVLLGIPFTVMSVALFPLLMGLGVDYSVHLFHNYRTEIKNGKKPGKTFAYLLQHNIYLQIDTRDHFVSFRMREKQYNLFAFK